MSRARVFRFARRVRQVRDARLPFHFILILAKCDYLFDKLTPQTC